MKNFLIIFFIGMFFFQNSFAEKNWLDVNKIAEEQAKNESEKWIYFFDAIKKQIVKWFNYNDEFDSTSNPQLLENWKEAVYSIWDTIFFKESSEWNFPNNEDLWILDFWKIKVNENSVKLFKTEIQWKNLALSWKDEDKFDWYLIQIKDKIDWFLDWNSKSLVYFLKKEWTNYTFDFWDNKNIFFTEKKFESPELKIFLDDNFFYAKIFWTKNWKLSTASAEKILYWEKKNLVPKKISTVEKFNFPILVENYLKISDFQFVEKQDWDIFSWDFDWDEIFEKKWEKIFLPIQEDTWKFFINLKVERKNWKKIIKKIQLNFFAPKIFFDSEKNWKIFWYIKPWIWNFPVYYSYSDENSARISDKILTDKNWKFSFLKQSEKKSRNIYWENWENFWEIFSKTWNVELKFSDKYWDFLVIYDEWKVIWVFYSSGKIDIYDKTYSYFPNLKTPKKNDLFIKKDWKNKFYLNL